MTQPDHQPESVLTQKLQDAAAQVPVGASYAHYKHPELRYTIAGHCILEASDEAAVIYRANYGERITYARALDVFLESVEWQGQTVPRFTRLAD